VTASTSTTFRRPRWGWFALLDGGIVVLSVLANRSAYRKASATIPLPPRSALGALLAATFLIHLAEGVVAGTKAGRRGMPRGRWALQTFVVGFPSLIELRRTSRADRVG
jgi:hypothetical protein